MFMLIKLTFNYESSGYAYVAFIRKQIEYALSSFKFDYEN
jgi:hypothetical protein